MKLGRPHKFQEPTTKFLVLLPLSVLQRLKEMKEVNGKSITEAIREALNIYFKQGN